MGGSDTRVESRRSRSRSPAKSHKKRKDRSRSRSRDRNVSKHRKRSKSRSRSESPKQKSRRRGINKAVASDVQDVFKGKTSDQLSQLQLQIERKLSQRAEGVDVGYWESLLSQLKAHLARARLKDKHSENLRRKLELLKAEQGVESDHEDVGSNPGKEEVPDEDSEEPSAEQVENPDESADEETLLIDNTLEEYVAGNYRYEILH